MRDKFDVVVVGGGKAGENVASRCAKSGLSVAIVERELVGGECPYFACLPSKALLRPGEVLAAARRVPGARAAVTGTIDIEAVLEHRDSLARHWDDSREVQWVEKAGVSLVRGHARLAGVLRIDVETEDGNRRLEARKAVVIATGSSEVVPPISGLEDVTVWNSRDVTTAKELPGRLLVVGGGVVGVEMAQAWRQLGADEVTVVERMDRLLPLEEPFAGEELKAALESDGIVVLTGRTVTALRRRRDGPVSATLDDGAELTGDEILIAVGRRPNTENLGLETIGLEPGKSIQVNDQLQSLRTENSWLYAVGDVNGRALLTHMGKYQARLAADHILGNHVEAFADHHAVPRVVFTDPAVAAVGLTERLANEQGLNVLTLAVGTGDVAGAEVLGKGISGTSQLVVDADRGVIVGATLTGPGVGEMLHAATIAIVGEVPLARLWHAVPAFPTVSEVWLRLLEACNRELVDFQGGGRTKCTCRSSTSTSTV